MRHKGFIALRSFIALTIIMLYLPLITCILIYVSDINYRYDLLNDELSLLQLRRIMLLSYDIEVENNTISIIYGESRRKW